MLFHGDNLRFLRGMNSGTIDLIATDPPFNKGRDFHATPDSLADGGKFQDRWSWAKDVEQAWMDEIEDSAPGVAWAIEAARETYGEDMAAFLCFLGVRLMEMHRILTPTGSIYLHCDDTAGAYLKQIMDAIFGRDNFRNEITWKRTSSRSDAQRFGRVSDRILYYVKGSEPTWNGAWTPLDQDYLDKFYRNEDSRWGRWQSDQLTAIGLTAGDSGSPWRGRDPSDVGRHWAVPSAMPPEAREMLPADWEDLPTRKKLDVLDDIGLIYWPKRGGMPRFKRFLSTSKGRAALDIITDINPISAHAKERVGYPTQKPLALYERLIAASSNEGDWVMDPFCGCATTPIAAERLGRRWVGMDLWDGAIKQVQDRLTKEGGGLALDAPMDQPRMAGIAESVRYETEPPERTDGGEVAAPYLQVTERYDIPADGSPRTRAGMLDHLIAQYGLRCQGCDREFDDPRYLQLDHNTPHRDGGINHISNRVLLCGPCNRLKGAAYTLTGLRRENAKRGYMARNQ